MKKTNGIFILMALIFINSALAAKKVIQLPDLLKPHLIRVSGKGMFIAGDTTVYIYSMPDFRLKRKFGRAGEGPGELKSYISDLEIGENFILVNSNGRLSWFDLNGRFRRQMKDIALGHNYRILGDGFVGMRMIREKNGIFFTVNIFDSRLNTVKEIYRYRHPFFHSDRKINPVNLRISSYFVYQEKIFMDTADGRIQVFDFQGNPLYSVTPDLNPVKLTPELGEKYLGFWKSDLKAEYEVYKNRLVFPAYFPLIKDFRVADGKIYLLTYREKGEMSELLVMDLQGKAIAKTWVELADVNMLLPHLFCYYTIRGGKIYKLVDNPDRELWELKIEELEN